MFYLWGKKSKFHQFIQPPPFHKGYMTNISLIFIYNPITQWGYLIIYLFFNKRLNITIYSLQITLHNTVFIINRYFFFLYRIKHDYNQNDCIDIKLIF